MRPGPNEPARSGPGADHVTWIRSYTRASYYASCRRRRRRRCSCCCCRCSRAAFKDRLSERASLNYASLRLQENLMNSSWLTRFSQLLAPAIRQSGPELPTCVNSRSMMTGKGSRRGTRLIAETDGGVWRLVMAQISQLRATRDDFKEGISRGSQT